MPTETTWVYPKPKDWDEFENIVWDLFRKEWQDPDAQRYGRSGQEQHGIDVYGRPRDMDGAYVGVQCKRYEDEKLTETIIRNEIGKVELGIEKGLLPFQPAKLIIATTASRDKNLQDAIVRITKERKESGGFPISLSFWEDLSDMLSSAKYEDIRWKHYPTLARQSIRDRRYRRALVMITPLVFILAVLSGVEMIWHPLEPRCQLEIGQQVHVKEGKNVWPTPDVLSEITPERTTSRTLVYIISGPKWGLISWDPRRKDWWWEISDTINGESLGWLYEGFMEECQSSPTPPITLFPTITTSPSPTPTPTQDYTDITIIAVADLYKMAGDVIQVDRLITSDIVDSIIDYAKNIPHTVEVIRLNEIIEDSLQASNIAEMYSSAEAFLLIYGGTEIMGQSTVVDFSIYTSSKQVLLPFTIRESVPQQQVESGLIRIEYPEQIQSALSYIFGLEAYINNNYSSSIKLLTDALAVIRPIENMEIHFYLANAMFYNDDSPFNHPRIIEEYQQAIELSNSNLFNAVIYYNWGIICSLDSDKECAREKWQHAILENNSFFEAHHNLGILHLEDENWEAAQVEFKAALLANPDSGESYDGLGTALYYLGDIDAAVDAWESAVEKSPDFCIASYNLAFGYYFQEHLQDAINMTNLSLKCDPSYANAWHLLGVALYESQMPEEAQKACLKLKELDSDLGECEKILNPPIP